MSGTVYFLALVLFLSSLPLRGQVPLSPLPGATVVQRYTPPPPGLLEAFLKETPNAAVVRHNLGGLRAPGGASAQFIALIASDPSHPGHEAKGIEVVLKEGKRKSTVYLDYDTEPDGHSDSLDDLERKLTFLAEGGGQVLQSHQSALLDATDSSQLVFHGAMTTALNRAGYSLVWCCPRYPHLDFGLYQRGTVKGVLIADLTSKPVTYWFPGSCLDEVVKIIQAGRKFVLEH